VGDINRSLVRAFGADKTAEVEKKLRDYFQVKHVFLLSSGKMSLYTILRAWNRPGKVVMPAYNCNVVPEAAVFAGYTPLLLDAGLDTLNVFHQDYKNALLETVTVIFAVSLFGIPYDVRPLIEIAARRGILLVEDAASAMGSRITGQFAGTVGDVGVISFQDTKPLSAHAGGAIITNDDQLAQKISSLIQNLKKPKSPWKLYLSSMFHRIATKRWLYPATRLVHKLLKGEAMFEIVPAPAEQDVEYFTRCAPFSAALINEQWDKFENNLTKRRKIACDYLKALDGHPAFLIPKIPEGIEPSYIQFPMLVKDKEGFYRYMQRHGIDVTWTYRYSCADEFPQKDCPNAERIAQSIISLPCYPDLSGVEVQKICQTAAAYTGDRFEE
jgi:dTDP-4-amino-4,6-dideoxygalactose transaminase